MTILQGVISPKPDQFYKLLKSLYSLKQESMKWNKKLAGVLLDQDYKQHTSNTLH